VNASFRFHDPQVPPRFTVHPEIDRVLELDYRELDLDSEKELRTGDLLVFYNQRKDPPQLHHAVTLLGATSDGALVHEKPNPRAAAVERIGSLREAAKNAEGLGMALYRRKEIARTPPPGGNGSRLRTGLASVRIQETRLGTPRILIETRSKKALSGEVADRVLTDLTYAFAEPLSFFFLAVPGATRLSERTLAIEGLPRLRSLEEELGDSHVPDARKDELREMHRERVAFMPDHLRSGFGHVFEDVLLQGDRLSFRHQSTGVEASMDLSPRSLLVDDWDGSPRLVWIPVLERN
jgi:hypothetical protein